MFIPSLTEKQFCETSKNDIDNIVFLLNILSRIPIKAVFTCKCVCKSWLNLLETPEFARSHLSKSAPGLLIRRSPYTNNTEKNVFKIFEFEDSPEVERHEHHYKTVLELDIAKIFDVCDGSAISIKGSANGLIFLRNLSTSHYVCNPITRKYIKLPVAPEEIRHQNPATVPYGFGMSRLSNQFKVVRILLDRVYNPDMGLFFSIRRSVSQVYTLGIKSWRSNITTPSGMLLDYSFSDVGVLLDGNLHWLARDSIMGSCWISCFDLENEAFTEFRAPIAEPPRGRWYALAIGVLRDRLCLCDNSSKSEINIYMSNDYGDGDKSWSKEYVLRNNNILFARKENTVVYAVKAFEDGDLLMVSLRNRPSKILYYSNRSKTIELPDDIFSEGSIACLEAILYTPSFISLKEYETENAKLFEFACVMS